MSWSVSWPHPPIVVLSCKGQFPHWFFFHNVGPRCLSTWPMQSLFTISTPSPYGLSATTAGYDLLSPSSYYGRRLTFSRSQQLQCFGWPIRNLTALTSFDVCLYPTFVFITIWVKLGMALATYTDSFQQGQIRILPLAAAVARTSPYELE